VEWFIPFSLPGAGLLSKGVKSGVARRGEIRSGLGLFNSYKPPISGFAEDFR